MKFKDFPVIAVLALAAWSSARADDFTSRCADRAAIERVYYLHRTGTKPPFEQALPPGLLDRLVRQDLHKEAVLRKAYGVEIIPAMVAAEEQRIIATTRAPEMLAEIKQALGDDPARFATALARPLVVDRELRRRFESDDKVHAGHRHEAEQRRADLLAKQPVKGLDEMTWLLTPRPAGEKPGPVALPPSPVKAASGSSTYSNEATVQLSQAPAPSVEATPGKEKVYFADLEPELRQVLRTQLQKPGDVSAVIETPDKFLVFLAKEKTPEALTTTSVSIPKRSFEEWLAGQPE